MSEQLIGAIIGAVATLAAAVLGVGARAWLRGRQEPSGSSYGIKITSPGHGVIASGTLEVSGTYRNPPPDGALWLLNFDRNGPQYWPQVGQKIEMNKTRKTWRGTSWINTDTRVVVATGGSETARLFRYYEKVGLRTGTWPGIDDFPSDLVQHDEVWVQHK